MVEIVAEDGADRATPPVVFFRPRDVSPHDIVVYIVAEEELSEPEVRAWIEKETPSSCGRSTSDL